MNSLTHLGAKTVMANKSFFARKIWTQSINWQIRDTNRLLSALNHRKTYVVPINTTVCRLASSSAVDQSGHQTGGHNHSKLWSLERYLSVGLLAVIPVSLVVRSPALDYLLALSLVTHVHWGVEAIVVDYIRPSVFGKVIPKLALAYVYVLSILALSGLFYFNYTDVGLTNAIRMIAKM